MSYKVNGEYKLNENNKCTENFDSDMTDVSIGDIPGLSDGSLSDFRSYLDSYLRSGPQVNVESRHIVDGEAQYKPYLKSNLEVDKIRAKQLCLVNKNLQEICINYEYLLLTKGMVNSNLPEDVLNSVNSNNISLANIGDLLTIMNNNSPVPANLIKTISEETSYDYYDKYLSIPDIIRMSNNVSHHVHPGQNEKQTPELKDIVQNYTITGDYLSIENEGYTIYQFISGSGSIEILDNNEEVDILMIGGGGGNGGYDDRNGVGGYGGAGGVISTMTSRGSRHDIPKLNLQAGQTYNFNVGTFKGLRQNGGDTTFSGLGVNLIAKGGGRGGWRRRDTKVNGANGGSGGGAPVWNNGGNRWHESPGSGTENQGHNGSTGAQDSYLGGGGGGAGGSAGRFNQHAWGGDGITSNITGTTYKYAAGGSSGIRDKNLYGKVRGRNFGNYNANSGEGSGNGGGSPGIFIIKIKAKTLLDLFYEYFIVDDAVERNVYETSSGKKFISFKFTNNQSFTLIQPMIADIILVGGGGAGGSGGDIVNIPTEIPPSPTQNFIISGEYKLINDVEGYLVYQFVSGSGSIEILDNNEEIDILMIGGGGGNGGYDDQNGVGGYGGAGGVISTMTSRGSRHDIPKLNLQAGQTYNFDVGTFKGLRQNGGDTTFSGLGVNLIAKGGGRGGWRRRDTKVNGANGGSGGGAPVWNNGGNRWHESPGSGTENQGHNGSTGAQDSYLGGGGGGAGGSAGRFNQHAWGGDGITSNITGTTYKYGAGGSSGIRDKNLYGKVRGRNFGNYDSYTGEGSGNGGGSPGIFIIKIKIPTVGIPPYTNMYYNSLGGGGGAGEVVESLMTNFMSTTYYVKIGQGGSRNNYTSGENGEDSTIINVNNNEEKMTAKGGGGGGGPAKYMPYNYYYENLIDYSEPEILENEKQGKDGGSGGGGGGSIKIENSVFENNQVFAKLGKGGSTISGGYNLFNLGIYNNYVNSGSSSGINSNNMIVDTFALNGPGGGGGGAGEKGQEADKNYPLKGGKGGDGKSFLLWNNTEITYGGGGGGGGIGQNLNNLNGGVGGSGGGGNGGGGIDSTTHSLTMDGDQNTGSGGGGNSGQSKAGNGGSGVCILRFQIK